MRPEKSFDLLNDLQGRLSGLLLFAIGAAFLWFGVQLFDRSPGKDASRYEIVVAEVIDVSQSSTSPTLYAATYRVEGADGYQHVCETNRFNEQRPVIGEVKELPRIKGNGLQPCDLDLEGDLWVGTAATIFLFLVGGLMGLAGLIILFFAHKFDVEWGGTGNGGGGGGDF